MLLHYVICCMQSRNLQGKEQGNDIECASLNDKKIIFLEGAGLKLANLHVIDCIQRNV